MIKQHIKEAIAKYFFIMAAATSIVSVLFICVFLFSGGIPAMSSIGIFKFLFGTEWSPSDIPPSFGILPMIMGSILITTGAIILGVPIGILSAVFMARFCHKSAYKIIKPCVDLLAGIPSIVYGFFGMIVLIPLVKSIFGGNGNSILTASILLAIMILPTVIGITESALKAVPNTYYEGALALGASHERSVFFIIIPAAKSGIAAAIVLAIGRAIGETMAVVMVAGNQARMPTGLTNGIRSLTSNIVLEMGYAADLHREALISCGVVLFVIILSVNLILSFIIRRNEG